MFETTTMLGSPTVYGRLVNRLFPGSLSSHACYACNLLKVKEIPKNEKLS